jgi:RNA polymerase sigma-70 factor (ECF subfamily)
MEAGLLARVADGDEAAFRVLVDRHVGSLTGVARRMLADGAEAEDVAQETFVRLWRSAGDLEIGGPGVRPWLMRVATNLCLDRLRARRRLQVDADVPETPVSAVQARGLEEQQLSERVETALAALPERQRSALVLFHYEGLSQMEVAEAMDVSEEAVESLLARARRAVRGSLANEWRGLLPDA